MSVFRRRDTVRFALSAAVVTHTSTTQMAQTKETHTHAHVDAVLAAANNLRKWLETQCLPLRPHS